VDTTQTDILLFLNNHKPKALRFSAFIICLLLTIALIWAFYTNIEQVSIATGEVAPKEKVKVIQHLEGGIIQEILIHEGDSVKQGQVLYRLGLGVRKINLKEKIAELDGLNLTKARLIAQKNGTRPVFPELASKRHKNLLITEQEAYYNSLAEKQQALVVAQKNIDNKTLLVKELQMRLFTAREDLKFQNQQVKISNNLYKSALTSESENISEKSEQNILKGKIDVLKYSIPRAQAELLKAEEEKKHISVQFNNEMARKLANIEQQIARLVELLKKAEEQNIRTRITSPIEGIIKKMRHNTLYGVVKPGEPIVEIVPLSSNLIIEAKLNPVDRGYVLVNQDAKVKISTYEFTRFGGIDGKVIRMVPTVKLIRPLDEVFLMLILKFPKTI